MLSGLLDSLGFGKSYPTITKLDMERLGNDPSDGGLLLICAGKDVFDVTQYVMDHPGGPQALIKRGGGAADCTRDLNFHSSKARAEWKSHKVAEIGDVTTLVVAKSISHNTSFAASPVVAEKPVGSIVSSKSKTTTSEFVSVEDAHQAGRNCPKRHECSCSCRKSETIGTQTLCCRAGTGLPCCKDQPPTASPTTAGSPCIWTSSGTGSFVRQFSSANASFVSTPSASRKPDSVTASPASEETTAE